MSRIICVRTTWCTHFGVPIVGAVLISNHWFKCSIPAGVKEHTTNADRARTVAQWSVESFYSLTVKFFVVLAICEFDPVTVMKICLFNRWSD